MCVIFCIHGNAEISLISLLFIFMIDQSIFYKSFYLKEFLWLPKNTSRSLKHRNWNCLQHWAQENPHTEYPVKLAPKLNIFTKDLVSFRCCFSVTASGQLSCLLPVGSYSGTHCPDYLHQAPFCASCNMDSLIQTVVLWKTTVIFPYLRRRSRQNACLHAC